MKKTIVILVAFLTIFIYSFSLSYSFDSKKLTKEELLKKEQKFNSKKEQYIIMKENNKSSFIKQSLMLRGYNNWYSYSIGYSVEIEHSWPYRKFWSGSICLETYPQSYWEWYVSFKLVKYWFWSDTNYWWRTVKVNNYRRTVRWDWLSYWDFKLVVSNWARGWVFDNSAQIYNCD